MKATGHAGFVRSWAQAAAKDAPAASLPSLFEAAWGAVRRRAENAVGEIVLASISEIVRAKSAEKYPFLAALTVDGGDISCGALADAADLPPGALLEGLEYLLTEFLTVLGDLTDQVLTPGLYAELDKTGAGKTAVRTETSKPEENAMTKELMPTGVRNLDAILGGGLIRGSSLAIAGPPGSGKTILAQQLAFLNATPEHPVLFFSTLSEPGVKNLFYLKRFSYADPKKIGESIHFVDLGVLVRTNGLAPTLALLLERVQKLEPAIVIIDSFKVFGDMAESPEELRKFTYELVVNFMARKCTSIFLGEYTRADYERNPLFSIIDGMISMSQRQLSGENQRFIQIVKMRGLAHSLEEHAFAITKDGVEVYAPRLTITRQSPKKPAPKDAARCVIGIAKLDDLLGGGVPRGSSLLISGVAGTGKTVLGLEFIYRGAKLGEKGIVFSFEETEERLRAEARGLHWDFDAQIEKGMIEIVFIPQPDILVERDLLMMREKVDEMKAARITLDSLSVFLHKVDDPQAAREKVFQLCSIVQNAHAVGFFATDVPYGTTKISRFGVEETVVDGVVILSSTEENMERQRYIEVYKLRNTAHLKGRHSMSIGDGGINIFPRYQPPALDAAEPPVPKALKRLTTGVPGLDKLLGGGVLANSMTLVSGSAGIGKSVTALQFVLEGASRGERGLFVTLEEGPEELIANAAALGLSLREAIAGKTIDVLYLPPTRIRSMQLLALLADKIKHDKTRRLAFDSATHIMASGMTSDDARELLYDLVVHFRGLGVTSLFTLESESMYSRDFGTERGYSALADNVVMLRYAAHGALTTSAIMVVKTRGSAHDNTVHSFTIGKGGLHVGGPLKHSVTAVERTAETAANGRRH